MIDINKTGSMYNHSVFNDMSKYSYTPLKPAGYKPLPQIKLDSFELTKENSQKKSLFSNKKFLIGTAIAATALIAVAMRKKNIPALKGTIKSLPQPNSAANKTPNPVSDIPEKLSKATKMFIDDLQNHGEASANGVCFWGVDSPQKEQIFEGFVNKMSEAGYIIERVPQGSEENVKKLSDTLRKIMFTAEEKFKKTKAHTAIVIRNFDSIAQDRVKFPEGKFANSLLELQSCKEKGIALISEAKDINNIDTALRRFGRMEITIGPII